MEVYWEWENDKLNKDLFDLNAIPSTVKHHSVQIYVLTGDSRAKENGEDANMETGSVIVYPTEYTVSGVRLSKADLIKLIEEIEWNDRNKNG